MSNGRIKAIKARITALQAELNDPYTASLGKAALRCVRESLVDAERQLTEATAG